MTDRVMLSSRNANVVNIYTAHEDNKSNSKHISTYEQSASDGIRNGNDVPASASIVINP